MSVFQGITFAVFNSDFCDKYDCDLGRSSRMAIAALVLAVAAGMLMFFTKDHPGPGEQQDAQPPVAEKDVVSVTEAHHGDEEAHIQTNDGTTDIHEVPVENDYDASLLNATEKKSIENSTTPVVVE